MSPMSSTPSQSRTESPEGDGGFTIIEVLVSFTLLAIVTLGTVPLFISALRGTLISKLDTGAKNLSQERSEIMRNLPFHLDVNTTLVPDPSKCQDPARTDPTGGSGAVECDFRDLLDTYYRSLNASGSVTAGGYVDPGGARTADEPAGAFYRFVINPLPGFSGRYSQVIATQFLDAERNPITPSSSYNSQTSGFDFPPTRLLGVTVITTWKAGNLSKKLVAFTQIAEGEAGPPIVTTQARATAVRITSGLPPVNPGDPSRLLLMEAGISSADGALSTGATAATKAQGSFAYIAPGNREDSKNASASAPPNQTIVDDEGGPFSLVDGGASDPGCVTFDCVAYSLAGQIRSVRASIISDHPIVASSSSPSTGRVRRNSGSGKNLGYSNKPNDVVGMPELDLSKMLVRIEEGTEAPTATGSTYLNAVGGGAHFAEAGTAASTLVVKIIPTTFAADGLVQVQLKTAKLVCKTTGASATVTADFEATVRYLQYNPATKLNEYVEVKVEDGGSSPLTADLLASIQVTTNPGFTPANLVPLSNYIAGWGSLSGATSTIGTPPTTVSSTLSGIVNVTTQPTRAADPSSTVAVQVGVLTCVAEDNR